MPSSSVDAGVAVSQLEGGLQSKLPPLAQLTNVVATLNDDSASIEFDPVDGALDYRVYPLPSDGDISVASDGSVVVHNGTYRCAGNRETPTPNVDTAMSMGSWINTEVDQEQVGGYTRTISDATLGYVYTQPGPGLTPVYALGDADPSADDSCYFARWAASRVKKYTTSETERTSLLAALSRDDGIAFYVPTTADATTKAIYFDEDQVGTKFMSRYYFGDGPEAAVHTGKQPAFAVLSSQAPNTEPLMRVFYSNSCGWSHDELAVGQERFNRIYKQGDKLPWWSLLWTGITAPTTLVVEALDQVCPYQGNLSPTAIPSITAFFGSMPLVHQPYVTLDQARAASATGEVFINGQMGPAWLWEGGADGGAPSAPEDGGATGPLPKAIARSFVNVAPLPHPKMDFFADFSPSTPPEVFADVNCGSPDQNCGNKWHMQSPTFDATFLSVESAQTPDQGLFGFGPVMGELWVTYADLAADTNGKFRLTALQKANLDSSTFLHVTMEVDAFSTARRYPQILISDQEAPIQYTLDQGHTLIVQTRGEETEWVDYPISYQLQICNLRTWDVNNQCPVYDLDHLLDSSGNIAHLGPHDEVGEHTSVDHRVLFDVYTSTQRTYLFLEGKPYACADLPSVGPPSGPVTVTWGDVLYHSAVDHTFAFHQDHLQIDTRRHFDNLGFSSGVPAPPWDETTLPCAAPISL